MYFLDRESAAYLLAQRLKQFKGQNPLVVGIPRGAIPMVKIVAAELQGEVAAVFVHKISAPQNPEYAIACVGISGDIHYPSGSDAAGMDSSYIKAQAKEQLEVLRKRARDYGMVVKSFKDRIVILLDDGIATGATTICAIHEIRKSGPRSLIVATPVASAQAAEKIRPLVDELIALDLPRDMYAIGQYYQHFNQVSDEEVKAILSYRRFPSLGQISE